MITQRSFLNEADKHAMLQLVHAHPQSHVHVVDLPYRLCSWAFDIPENSMLWFNEQNELMAWAVLQPPFWTIDYALHPQAGDELHQTVLNWANERAEKILDLPSGHPAWFVHIFSDQGSHIHHLEKAGFASQTNVAEDPWSKVFMRWEGSGSTYSVPAGYAIRPLQGEKEVNGYVDLHQAVFQSKNMTADWRGRTLYFDPCPAADMVAVAPDGSLAAFCIGWLHGDKGQIEPLGVHENHRGQGLGQAILFETIQALRRQGAREIFVETDNFRDAALQLYESVGFHILKNVTVYRKDYQ